MGKMILSFLKEILEYFDWKFTYVISIAFCDKLQMKYFRK